MKNIEVLNNLKQLEDEKGILKDSKSMPMKLNWNLSKNYKKMVAHREEMAEFEKSLFQKHRDLGQVTDVLDSEGNPVLDENGNQTFSLTIAAITDINEQLSELLNDESGLEIISIPFSIVENLELTPMQCESIMFMIEE